MNPNTSCATASRIFALFAFAAAFTSTQPVRAADEGDRIVVQIAPDVVHYHDSTDYHAKRSWLIGTEYLRQDGWLAGYAYFNNSFDQRSHYAYGGRTWKLDGEDSSYWYLKLTGGIILGYRDKYEDKIPFNHSGVAPGIIPGVGYQLGRFSVQLNVLGAAGMMLTLGYDIAR